MIHFLRLYRMTLYKWFLEKLPSENVSAQWSEYMVCGWTDNDYRWNKFRIHYYIVNYTAPWYEQNVKFPIYASSYSRPLIIRMFAEVCKSTSSFPFSLITQSLEYQGKG